MPVVESFREQLKRARSPPRKNRPRAKPRVEEDDQNRLNKSLEDMYYGTIGRPGNQDLSVNEALDSAQGSNHRKIRFDFPRSLELKALAPSLALTTTSSNSQLMLEDH